MDKKISVDDHLSGFTDDDILPPTLYFDRLALKLPMRPDFHHPSNPHTMAAMESQTDSKIEPVLRIIFRFIDPSSLTDCFCDNTEKEMMQ